MLEITVLPPQLQGSHASVEGEVVNRGRGRRRNKEKKIVEEVKGEEVVELSWKQKQFVLVNKALR